MTIADTFDAREMQKFNHSVKSRKGVLTSLKSFTVFYSKKANSEASEAEPSVSGVQSI